LNPKLVLDLLEGQDGELPFEAVYGSTARQRFSINQKVEN
jgi:hypothetical protein